jgi:subtilisin family serine protease
MKSKLFLALILVSLGLVIVFNFSVNKTSASAAAGQGSQEKFLKAEHAIPGNYIVVLNEQAGNPHEEALSLASTYGGSARHVYARALKGFSVTLPEAAAIALSRDPRVSYVEEDSEVSLAATHNNATWGIDRVDQRDLPLNGDYNYNFTGTGVTAYIIDTGIRATHSEFGGRVAVSSGFTAINDGQGTNDCNGHGTHVAGTVGGATFGVAKNVTLVPIRVLGCSGTGATSGVIAAIEYVTSVHQAGAPAVANVSLSTGASSSFDRAVNNAIDDGVVFTIAAGNTSTDACALSPARVTNALTVGATTTADARASFSNFGSCVDLFAPGSSIVSAGITSDTATATISGTSMASPHVAGVAALLLESNPGASVATVNAAILSNATVNKVTNPGAGSPNRLLFSLTGSAGGGGIALSADGLKQRGLQKADLTWFGASSTNVDIYRDGVIITTTANDGSHRDDINNHGNGSYTYKVCEAGTSTCSSEVTVSF